MLIPWLKHTAYFTTACISWEPTDRVEVGTGWVRRMHCSGKHDDANPFHHRAATTAPGNPRTQCAAPVPQGQLRARNHHKAYVAADQVATFNHHLGPVEHLYHLHSQHSANKSHADPSTTQIQVPPNFSAAVRSLS